MKLPIKWAAALLLLFVTALPAPAVAQDAEIAGLVADETGGAIAGAQLVLHTTHGVPVGETRAAANGTFAIGGMPSGSYWLEVTAEHFTPRRIHVEVGGQPVPPLEILLSLAPFGSEVTVTAERGMVSDIEEVTPIVTVRDQDDFRRQPLPTIGNALTGAAGVMTQQSTYGQVSPFLRGLTGYQVLNLIDGVRFNNSTFRSGPNQYLAFADPSQAQRIEAMLGPSSSQFGSDAMGGTIQLLTPAPRFNGSSGLGANGSVNLFAASADESGGGDATVFVRGSKASLGIGGAWRELNDLRAGQGRDSHHVLTRLFGLSDDQIREIDGGRQTGTGFSQSGLHAKFAARLGNQQNVTAWFQGSEMNDVRGYKDLWGGLGRVRSDFDPQRLRFFYGRYEALGVGGLDSLSGTFSVNSQTDGSVRQGLKATDPITDDDVRADALGYALQATTHLTSRQDIVFGGEIYDEHIDARRDVTNPQTGVVEQRRALYPNGSRYRTSGLFVQDAVTIVPDKSPGWAAAPTASRWRGTRSSPRCRGSRWRRSSCRPPPEQLAARTGRRRRHHRRAGRAGRRACPMRRRPDRRGRQRRPHRQPPGDHAAADDARPARPAAGAVPATPTPLRVGAGRRHRDAGQRRRGVRDGGGLRRHRRRSTRRASSRAVRTPCGRCSPRPGRPT